MVLNFIRSDGIESNICVHSFPQLSKTSMTMTLTSIPIAEMTLTRKSQSLRHILISHLCHGVLILRRRHRVLISDSYQVHKVLER